MTVCINVNCIYNDDRAWCKNKNVKRSLFGFGARCCIDYPYSKGCKFKEPYPRPEGPPPPPPPKRKIKEDISFIWLKIKN